MESKWSQTMSRDCVGIRNAPGNRQSSYRAPYRMAQMGRRKKWPFRVTQREGGISNSNHF